MCRQPWQGEYDPHEALAKGTVNEEGYLNVASELGMSGYRGEFPCEMGPFGFFSYYRLQILPHTTIRHTIAMVATDTALTGESLRAMFCQP